MTKEQQLKEIRLARHMSLEDVGNAVGVGKSTIRKWENGDIANMGRDKVSAWANALGVSPAFIMGWTNDPYDFEAMTPVDADALAFCEAVRRDPQTRVLFSLMSDATPELMRQVIAIVKVLMG